MKCRTLTWDDRVLPYIAIEGRPELTVGSPEGAFTTVGLEKSLKRGFHALNGESSLELAWFNRNRCEIQEYRREADTIFAMVLVDLTGGPEESTWFEANTYIRVDDGPFPQQQYNAFPDGGIEVLAAGSSATGAPCALLQMKPHASFRIRRLSLKRSPTVTVTWTTKGLRVRVPKKFQERQEAYMRSRKAG